MKLTANRDALLDALTRVQSVVSTKSTIPVLANVLLRAEEGKLRLVTTDLEVSVRTEVPAEVVTPGETTLPAKRFFAVIRELPPHAVEIETPHPSVAARPSLKSWASPPMISRMSPSPKAKTCLPWIRAH